MNEQSIIASFNCSECSKGKFHFFQLNNDLYTVCCNCGHITLLSEIIKQMEHVKQQIKKEDVLASKS